MDKSQIAYGLKSFDKGKSKVRKTSIQDIMSSFTVSLQGINHENESNDNLPEKTAALEEQVQPGQQEEVEGSGKRRLYVKGGIALVIFLFSGFLVWNSFFKDIKKSSAIQLAKTDPSQNQKVDIPKSKASSIAQAGAFPKSCKQQGKTG